MEGHVITGTDTGVHAKFYIAHFDSEVEYSTEMLNDICYKLNGILPDDIAVQEIFPVKEDAHARFSALSRTYEYHILQRKNPFFIDSAYYYHGKLNIDLMNKASRILFDYIDFTSFSKLDTQTKTNNCKIIHAEWNIKNDLLIFTITADRFLRNMVRAIVGTLMDVGKEKISNDDFRKIIESKNRCDAGFSVPACGLFLTDIQYPSEIFIGRK